MRVTKHDNNNHSYKFTKPRQRVRVLVDDVIIADSLESIALYETEGPTYHGLYYLPKKDIELSYFSTSSYTDYCPIKGYTLFFHLHVHVPYTIKIKNIAKTYLNPPSSYQMLKGLVAFSPDKVSFRLDPLGT